MKTFLALSASLIALTTLACSSDDGKTGSSASALELKGETPLFPGFSYDSGLQPAASPVQASFKSSVNGALRISAGAAKSAGKLAGAKGSGKLAVELHAKLEGQLKVSSSLAKYDGPIPGLDNLDIPIAADSAFDPFLLGDGEEAATDANAPPTALPDIPLASVGVPGTLKLTVKEGTVVHAKIHGTCVRATGGTATFEGATSTSGTIVLGASIKLDLPGPLSKPVDLPDIKMDLPTTEGTLSATSAAAGLADFSDGACAASTDAPAPGDGTPDNTADAGSSVPSGGACTDLQNVGAAVRAEAVTGDMPMADGGDIVDGTYALVAVHVYGFESDGTTLRRTIRIAKGRYESVTEDLARPGKVDRSSATYEAGSGGTLARTYTCPKPDSDDAEYSADPATLTLFFRSDGVAYVYGKL